MPTPKIIDYFRKDIAKNLHEYQINLCRFLR